MLVSVTCIYKDFFPSQVKSHVNSTIYKTTKKLQINKQNKSEDTKQIPNSEYLNSWALKKKKFPSVLPLVEYVYNFYIISTYLVIWIQGYILL